MGTTPEILVGLVQLSNLGSRRARHLYPSHNNVSEPIIYFPVPLCRNLCWAGGLASNVISKYRPRVIFGIGPSIRIHRIEEASAVGRIMQVKARYMVVTKPAD